MFKLIRSSCLGKNILGFLILVFLNSSIDAPDIFSKTIAYNEQETLIELIIEKALGFEDAIAEQNHDNELPEKSFSKKMPLQVRASEIQSETVRNNLFERFKVSNYLIPIHDKTYFKIIIPPPEFRV